MKTESKPKVNPKLVVEIVLLFDRDVHENEVANEVCWAQINACRIQASDDFVRTLTVQIDMNKFQSSEKEVVVVSYGVVSP
jgi:hypothetical protein